MVVASYTYDAWGVVTSDTESFANDWHNSYLYDGKDGARYDAETGLYWLAVRAYDPTLGRFLARDPLGRAPLIGWADQPYVYAGNNPLVNVDPSGQRFATEGAAQTRAAASYQRRAVARIVPRHPIAPKCDTACQRNKAIVALTSHYESLRAQLHLAGDILMLIGDLGSLLIDIVEAVVTKSLLAFGALVVDVLTVLADVGHLLIDGMKAAGKSSNDVAQIESFVVVLQGLAAAANFIVAHAYLLTFFELGLDGLFRAGARIFREKGIPLLSGLFFHLAAGGGAIVTGNDDMYNLDEENLPGMSLKQLQQQCMAQHVPCF